MPVPATTGQLRTRVQDMQIGDYIAVNLLMPSQSNIKILFNSTQGGELPLSGASWNGTTYSYFYMIKVAKGLLVADRVQYHSVSWDMLNTWKLIQGLSLDTGNIIPTMTSNNSPSGEASASTEKTIDRQAWAAFNRAIGGNGWCTTNLITTGWLQYKFDKPKAIRGYSMMNWSGYPQASPKDWTFLGSNDGVNWDMLDNRKNQSCTDNVWRKYQFLNNNEYLYYRINITANNGYANDVSISELQLYEIVGIIRSLTGGVAYADKDGNKSLTDQGYGAWPTNNEWDKYITNFPSNLIQPGKTLDDVFHHKNIWTLVQDTPVNTLKLPNGSGNAVNSYRIQRGSSEDLWFNPSNSSYNDSGFRPVFSYRE